MSSECFAIYYYHNESEKYIMELSKFNYFYRSKMGEIINVISKEIMDRTISNSIIDSPLEYGYVVGIKMGVSCCLIFTMQKNDHHHLLMLTKQILAYKLADTIVENFEYIKTMQKINNINNQVNNIKYILINNIELLFKRGEKIEDLIIKSKYLSDKSRDYFIKSKKLNSCCIIL